MAILKENNKIKENTAGSAQSKAMGTSPPTPIPDAEKQQAEEAIVPNKASALEGLGWLDRFLAIWILLAMIIGILLGNFVTNTGPALQKGKFVGVSVPIGTQFCPSF